MNITFREDSSFCSFFLCSKTLIAIVIALLLTSSNFVSAQDSTAAGAGSGGDIAKGESIFKNNCGQCHAVTDEVIVGPGLKGATTRNNIAWLTKWVHNSQAVIASGDAYGVALYNKFNKAQMTSFPNLSEDDIKGIDRKSVV